MQKGILTTICMCSALYSASFSEFLDLAVRSNPELNNASISIKQSHMEKQNALNYENPSLDVGISRFNPDAGKNDNGSFLSITQPIRLWSVGNDKEVLADANTQVLKSQKNLKYSNFSYAISIEYLKYIQQKKELTLTEESIAIAKRIYDISDEMYKSGNISRGEYLQAKVSFNSLSSDLSEQKYRLTKSYFSLLQFANIYKEIEIDTDHDFVLLKNKTLNPELDFLEKNAVYAKSKIAVEANAIESFDLSAEYESEPSEDIYRLGVSIPLTIFNTNYELEQIAKYEAQKQQTTFNTTKTKVEFEIKQLYRELKELDNLHVKYEKLLVEETELLEMFEESYKIARVNLFALQEIKNSLLNTKRNILNTKILRQENIIRINYLQGAFNE